MAQAAPLKLSPEQIGQLQKLRSSILDFRQMLDQQPNDLRSPDHNEQFNQHLAEAKALLNSPFTQDVPKAISGDPATDRSINIVVILGVILALVGLGVNSIILDDVIVNSLGCCISSGGMLLVMGAFWVLATRHYRQRISSIDDLRQRCDLLLYQMDHRLRMGGSSAETAQ